MSVATPEIFAESWYVRRGVTLKSLEISTVPGAAAALTWDVATVAGAAAAGLGVAVAAIPNMRMVSIRLRCPKPGCPFALSVAASFLIISSVGSVPTWLVDEVRISCRNKVPVRCR